MNATTATMSMPSWWPGGYDRAGAVVANAAQQDRAGGLPIPTIGFPRFAERVSQAVGRLDRRREDGKLRLGPAPGTATSPLPSRNRSPRLSRRSRGDAELRTASAVVRLTHRPHRWRGFLPFTCFHRRRRE